MAVLGTVSMLLVIFGALLHGNVEADDYPESFCVRMKRFFEVMDTNQDGKISIDDYQVLVDHLADARDLSDDIRLFLHGYETPRLWKDFPLDKDGEGTEVTFEQMLDSLWERRADPELKCGAKRIIGIAFDSANADDIKLSISLDEFKGFFSALGISEDVADEAFKAEDANNDGELSADEFEAAGLDFFFPESDNGPGALFYGELPATCE